MAQPFGLSLENQPLIQSRGLHVDFSIGQDSLWKTSHLSKAGVYMWI